MITGIGTAIAAIRAGVAAFIFWNQLGTMQAQLDEQRADFRLDERPIIALSAPPKDSPIPMGVVYDKSTEGLWWNYTAKNYGKGSAFHIRLFGYVSILGGPFLRKKGPLDEGQLVPTEDMWATAYYSDKVNADTLSLANSTDRGIVVKILIKYKDVYGTIYTSPICLAHDANGSVSNCDIGLISNRIRTEDDAEEKASR